MAKLYQDGILSLVSVGNCTPHDDLLASTVGLGKKMMKAKSLKGREDRLVTKMNCALILVPGLAIFLICTGWLDHPGMFFSIRSALQPLGNQPFGSELPHLLCRWHYHHRKFLTRDAGAGVQEVDGAPGSRVFETTDQQS